MNFSPEDFYKLAKVLGKDSNYAHLDDARIRTCIGRIYYSIFLEFREDLRRQIGNSEYNVVAKSGLIHSCLRKIIRKLDIKCGNKFDRLQKLRKEADYEIDAAISRTDLEESLAIAEHIFNAVSHLLTNLSVKKDDIEDIIRKDYQKLQKRLKN